MELKIKISLLRVQSGEIKPQNYLKCFPVTYRVHEDLHFAASSEHNDIIVSSQARCVIHPEDDEHLGEQGSNDTDFTVSYNHPSGLTHTDCQH